MIWYFSRKCIASSPTAWPHTSRLQPVSLIDLITVSSALSSELLYSLSSSADLSSTVPLVSVVAESSGMPYTATLASRTSVIEPMQPRVMHMPRTTVVPRMELPGILATRTLSTLKPDGSAGIARQHASAMRDAKSPSLPHCLAAITGVMHLARASGSLKTVGGGVILTRESRTSYAFSDAAVYPPITSEQCRPLLRSSSA